MKIFRLLVLVASSLVIQYCSAAVTKRSAAEDDTIYFPQSPMKPKPKPVIPTATRKPAISTGMSIKGDDAVPPECRGKNYCNVKTPDYPEKLFEKIFSNVTGSLFQPSLVTGPVDIVNRQGDPDEINDCDSTVTFEPLLRVKERDSAAWRYVVQAPERGIVQKVRLETCNNENSSCFKAISQSSDFTTMCKQLYNMWQVLVKKQDSDETETIIADLPVCCSCHYRLTFANRFGKPIGGKNSTG